MTEFSRILGIDYSGAGLASDGLPGLRVYEALPGGGEAREVLPPSGRRRWSRAALARWLGETLASGPRTLVGIDHALGLPLDYVRAHTLPEDWDAVLEDFVDHWPAHLPGVSVQSLREGNARGGSSLWRRRAEQRTRAKSVFHFDVQGAVAKSTHAGLPWILALRRTLGERLHVWPFDGWTVPPGRTVLAEVYPALWAPAWPRADRTPDQHDAFAVAAQLAAVDVQGGLTQLFHPSLDAETARLAERVEGWILGVA